MGVNLDKPHRWKEDIALSVDLYNKWFLRFAPKTYRQERDRAAKQVEAMLQRTDYFRNLATQELRENPSMPFALRMSTAPPIARDRLAGLANLPKSLITSMEKLGRLHPLLRTTRIDRDLRTVARLILRLLDVDIFPWLGDGREPTEQEAYRAATIVADRLCGANTDPIVRNAQEQRQLFKIRKWLSAHGYKDRTGRVSLTRMAPGTFAFRSNVPGLREDRTSVRIPVDVLVMPLEAKPGSLPFMIEAKSAGDFTNTNKRRKEEATKFSQLRRKHGNGICYFLFLCGYFDSGYLGYEAAEGIDWVWEHRINDLVEFGL